MTEPESPPSGMSASLGQPPGLVRAVALKRFGPYELFDRIGKGAQGTVFRARRDDGREVALKVIDGAQQRSRARRTFETLQGWKDDEIVTILDLVEEGTATGIVMALEKGLKLEEHSKDLGPVAVLELVAKIARALGRCHAKRVVHLDIKPDNIVVRPGGIPVVVDLGSWKPTGEAVSSLPGGTFRFMAPELGFPGTPVDPRADVFSLGQTLCQLLFETTRSFGARSFEDLTKLCESAVTGSRLDSNALARLIDRATSLESVKRPSASAFANDLDFVASGRRKRRLRPWQAIVAIVGAAGLGMAATSAGSRPSASSFREWLLAGPTSSSTPQRLPPGVEPGETPGEYVNRRDGSVLVYVPGGRFLVGCDSELQHEIKNPGQHPDLTPLEDSGYFIGKYEVSVEQFAAFVASNQYTTSAEASRQGGDMLGGAGQPAWRADPDAKATWEFPRGSQRRPAIGHHPVVQVSWRDAEAYVAWARLALPTVVEWQKAAAWDPSTLQSWPYPWRTTKWVTDWNDRGTIANLAKSTDGLADVRAFPASASAYGLYNSLGNAWEWCADEIQPATDESGRAMAIAGGCWNNSRVELHNLGSMRENVSNEVTGFRVCLRP